MTEKRAIRVINSVREMQALSNELRNEGRTISFVPTMGALHDGHLNLMKKGKKLGDILVTSVFVNPTQFGPGEDYKSYKRDAEGDLIKMTGEGRACRRYCIAAFPRVLASSSLRCPVPSLNSFRIDVLIDQGQRPCPGVHLVLLTEAHPLPGHAPG